MVRGDETMICLTEQIKNIVSERECFGKYEVEHKFCQSICCVRLDCLRKWRETREKVK